MYFQPQPQPMMMPPQGMMMAGPGGQNWDQGGWTQGAQQWDQQQQQKGNGGKGNGKGKGKDNAASSHIPWGTKAPDGRWPCFKHPGCPKGSACPYAHWNADGTIDNPIDGGSATTVRPASGTGNGAGAGDKVITANPPKAPEQSDKEKLEGTTFNYEGVKDGIAFKGVETAMAVKRLGMKDEDTKVPIFRIGGLPGGENYAQIQELMHFLAPQATNRCTGEPIGAVGVRKILEDLKTYMDAKGITPYKQPVVMSADQKDPGEQNALAAMMSGMTTLMGKQMEVFEKKLENLAAKPGMSSALSPPPRKKSAGKRGLSFGSAGCTASTASGGSFFGTGSGPGSRSGPSSGSGMGGSGGLASRPFESLDSDTEEEEDDTSGAAATLGGAAPGCGTWGPAPTVSPVEQFKNAMKETFTKTKRIGTAQPEHFPYDASAPLNGISTDLLGTGEDLTKHVYKVNKTNFLEFVVAFSPEEMKKGEMWLPNLIYLWRVAAKPGERMALLARTWNVVWEQNPVKEAFITILALVLTRAGRFPTMVTPGATPHEPRLCGCCGSCGARRLDCVKKLKDPDADDIT